MTTDIDTQEILKRLKALEDENRRLKEKTATKSVPLTVTEDNYKGHPVLTFKGPFRQFSVGLRKLRIIEETWPQVKEFLHKHSSSNEASTLNDDDDFKI